MAAHRAADQPMRRRPATDYRPRHYRDPRPAGTDPTVREAWRMGWRPDEDYAPGRGQQLVEVTGDGR